LKTGLYLRLQVKPTQLGLIDRASPYLQTVDNVQKHNILTHRIQTIKMGVFENEVRKLGVFICLHIKFVQIEDVFIGLEGFHGCNYDDFGIMEFNFV
jgi:hypothetical protein